MTQDYNTRRNELAEEMAKSIADQAKVNDRDADEWIFWPKKDRQILLAVTLPLADISLKHQAENILKVLGSDKDYQESCFALRVIADECTAPTEKKELIYTDSMRQRDAVIDNAEDLQF